MAHRTAFFIVPTHRWYIERTAATNRQNDVGYAVRGGEPGGTRTGLARATAFGWLIVGKLTVFVFLGLIAVTGAECALAGSVGRVTPIAAKAIGSLATAALAFTLPTGRGLQ